MKHDPKMIEAMAIASYTKRSSSWLDNPNHWSSLHKTVQAAWREDIIAALDVQDAYLKRKNDAREPVESGDEWVYRALTKQPEPSLRQINAAIKRLIGVRVRMKMGGKK